MAFDANTGGRQQSLLAGRLLTPTFGLTTTAFVLIGLLVLVPLAGIATALASADGLDAVRDVFTGRIARNMLWIPFTNTFVIGFVVAASCVLIGGGIAWLITMTDMPMRRTIGVLAALPFMIPTFAVALSWTVLFGDDRLGQTSMGLFAQLGMNVPSWLAWGGVPVTLVLIAHLYSIAYMMIAAALVLVGRDMTAAAEIAGASRSQTLRSIVFPVVTPTLVAAGALCFAEAVSSFSAPAILGLPVRFHTLATRAYGAIETGTPERGYVLIAVMIVVAGAFLTLSAFFQRRGQAFTTVTGKAASRGRMALGRGRWPFAVLALALVVATTIVPALALFFSSLSP